MENVLVLDGAQRSALAVVRSLGRHGVKLITADTQPNHLSGHSKYSSIATHYADPFADIDRFLQSLTELIQRYNITVVIPATDVTTNSLVLLRDRLPAHVKIGLPELTAYEQLTDKHALLVIAEKLGIPVPRSSLLQPGETLPAIKSFPVVVKPTRSKYLDGSCWSSSAVQIAHDQGELETIAQHQKHPFMLQAFIEGHGQGIFAIYEHGKPVCFFAHKRLREKPPSGGVSVLCESVEPDPHMVELSRQLLDHVGWHGVAMVEFKVALDGTPYLMEINTRFWGSLQLAVDSGVDFPFMLYQMATGQRSTPPRQYRLGQRLRWFLGDVDSLYLYLRDAAYSNSDKLQRLVQFCTPAFSGTRHEIFRWDDPGPAGFELKQYLRNLR